MTVQCPRCKGIGTVAAFVNAAPDCRHQYYEHSAKCFHCDGTGELDDGYPERAKAGKVLMCRRIALGLRIFEVCQRLGINPSALSDIEHGRVADDGRLAALLDEFGGHEKERVMHAISVLEGRAND